MADPYGKGSIVYKLLIVLLAGVLAVTIVYPKMLWDEEARNTELGRYRMTNLYNAELQFQRFHEGFTDSMDQLLEFVKSDSQYLHFVDSVVVGKISQAMNLLDTVRQIQLLADTLILAATDSATRDSVFTLEDMVTGRSRDIRDLLEATRERMKDLPTMPLPTFDKGLEIIERKDYFLRMEVVRRMVTEVGNLQLAKTASRDALANIDSISYHLGRTITEVRQFASRVDSFRYCPTVHRPYKIALEDSGVFRFANIYCPIDSTDIARAEQDFLKSKVGSLKLRNHGHIVKNEKSWEES